MQIKKRNGDLVNFNKQKIIDAINKAFIEVDNALYETDTANDIAEDIYKDIPSNASVYVKHQYRVAADRAWIFI